MGRSAVSTQLAVGAATLEVVQIAGDADAGDARRGARAADEARERVAGDSTEAGDSREAGDAKHARRAARRPTIVMLHEGLGCVAMWKELPAALVAALGLDVVVYSREGYGRSSPVPAVARPLDYLRVGGVRELVGLLDALALPEVILVGHSDGASIALACAAGAHAARLRGVVAIAPHTFVEEVGLAQIRVARQQYERGALVEPLARYHGENVAGAFWGWNRMWLDPAFTVAGLDGELPKLRVPVLAMQGRQDEYGTLRQLAVIAERSGGPVEQVVLEECGHSPHRAQPAATKEAIVRFVNGLR